MLKQICSKSVVIKKDINCFVVSEKQKKTVMPNKYDPSSHPRLKSVSCSSVHWYVFKFYFICCLHQVAHFYNTIDQQMLACQQAMMLDSALAFERLVKNPKAGNLMALFLILYTFT